MHQCASSVVSSRQHTKMKSFAVAAFVFLYIAESYGENLITVPNGGPWGSWGVEERCPAGTKAVSFSLKVEGPQKAGDDTALNGIKLICSDPTFSVRKEITSKVGAWGEWSKNPLECGSLLTAFQLRVQKPSGIEDDTGATNIRFRCGNGLVIGEKGLDWGEWGPWSNSCKYGICGLVTKVEGKKGPGDDTALNDVSFICCKQKF